LFYFMFFFICFVLGKLDFNVTTHELCI